MSKTILLIHGMWGGAWYWDNFQHYLTGKGYDCIAPNLRYHDTGSGEPPHANLATTSLLDYAHDLEQEIKALDSPPVIIGHSMGGLLAQMLAARGLAEKAVFITPASPAGIVPLQPSVLRSLQDIFLDWAFWKKTNKISYEKAVYATMHKLSENERQYIYNRCGYESGRALAEMAFGSFGMKGAQVDSTGVRCPVLVISASEDRITPVSMVKNIAKKYRPNSKYKEYPGHAHWIVREPGWEKVADDILVWLKGDK